MQEICVRSEDEIRLKSKARDSRVFARVRKKTRENPERKKSSSGSSPAGSGERRRRRRRQRRGRRRRRRRKEKRRRTRTGRGFEVKNKKAYHKMIICYGIDPIKGTVMQ